MATLAELIAEIRDRTRSDFIRERLDRIEALPREEIIERRSGLDRRIVDPPDGGAGMRRGGGRSGRRATVTRHTTDVVVNFTIESLVPVNFAPSDTHQISISSVNARDEALTPTVTYSSDDAGVATVNASGLVTAVGNGTATITITAGSVSKTVAYTVTTPQNSVASITVSPSTGALLSTGTLQLTATPWDGAGGTGNQVSGQTFTWASSNTAAATVNSSGLVTGVAAGSTNITATIGAIVSPNVVTTVSAPSAGHPNEPAGMTTIVDRPFLTKASSDPDRGTGNFPTKTGGSEGWDGIEWRYPNITIVNDATAPSGDSKGMRFSYPAQTVAAGTTYTPGVVQMLSMAGSAYNAIGGPFSHKNLYLDFHFRLSSNFQGHPTATNKLVFLRTRDGVARSEPIIRLRGVGSGDLRLNVDPQGSAEPDGTSYYSNTQAGINAGAEAVTRGVWHRVEANFIIGTLGSSNGSFKIWYDGALALDYSNIEWIKTTAFGENYWDNAHINPTWGGQGGTIDATFSWDLDTFYWSSKT